MFRRTLTALAAVLTLALAAVVVYAFLGLSGPETVVDEAEADFRRGDPTSCIRQLDRAERSLGRSGSPVLRARILRLRRDANIQVKNLTRALYDMDAILALGEAHPDALATLGLDPIAVALERIYYTLRAGNGEEALARANAMLAEQPEQPRALELAGEATYAIFAEKYAEFRDEISRKFDADVARRADEMLKVWLYRDETDPLARQARADFEGLLAKYQPGTPARSSFGGPLAELRRLIHSAQQFCRRAIVAPGGSPVAAYHLLRTALEKGQRYDDMQALAETYLLRFDHVFTFDAAADLAELHVDKGRHRAAIEVADRFLPTSSWRARLEELGAQGLPDETRAHLASRLARLLVARGKALDGLRDNEAAKTLLVEVDEMQKSIDLRPAYYLIRTLALKASFNRRQAFDELRTYESELQKAELTEPVREKRLEAVRLRGELIEELGWEVKPFVAMAEARFAPEDPAPWIEQARIYLQQSPPDLDSAQAAVNGARARAPHDDDVLRLHAEVVNLRNSKIGRGASDMLEDFVRLETVPANIPESVLWIPLAELALEKRQGRVAYEAARHAADSFNWARWPRVLESKAALANDEPSLAAQAAERLLTFFPNDAEGLRLLESARELQKLPTDDLLFPSLLSGRDDAGVARGLLRRARARGDIELASALADTITWRYKDDAQAMLVAADFFLEQGRNFFARKAIEGAAKLIGSDGPNVELYARTRASMLMIAALMRDEAAAMPLLESTRALYFGRTDELFQYARSLALIEQNRLSTDPLPYELAYELLRPILTDDIHRDRRSGVHFVLGGRLALRLGDFQSARRHLLQALTFDDGRDASRVLTLLDMSLDNRTDPADTFWEPRATDLVSACLSAHAGREVAAIAWAESQPSRDLPAECLRAVLGAEPNASQELRELVAGAPDELLDVLAFLEAIGFEPVAVQRATALSLRFPSNRYAKFLLARALANGGRRDLALPILGELMSYDEQYGEFTHAHEEAARLLHDSRVTDDEMAARVIRPFLPTEDEMPPPPPPVVREFAILSKMEVFEKPEERNYAMQLLANLWIQRPETVDLADVLLLDERGRPDLALKVLQEVDRRLPAAQRPSALRTYFSLVRRLEAESPLPSRVQEAKRFAETVITHEGAYGSVVHFLLRLEAEARGGADALRSDPVKVEEAKRLIEAHVQMFLDDRDRNVDDLVVSLRELATISGRADALECIDRVLAHDPSMPELWVLRSEWLAYEGRLEQARDDLLWIEQFLPRHPIRLDIAELNARAGYDDPRAEQQLRNYLGDEAFDGPGTALMRGLLHLRGGEIREAHRALGEAEPSPDGAHLFYLALTELALGDAASAAKHFEALANDYPKSLLSENASDFAKFCSH